MKKFLNLVSIVLIMTILSACVYSSSVDNNQPTQVEEAGELKVMNQFSRINLAGSMQVIYSQGDKYTVRVDAPQQAMEKLVIYVKSKELNIGSKDELLGFNNAISDIKIYVTSPVIKQIDLTGSGDLTVNNAVSVGRLDVELTGAGHLNFAGALTCSFLDVDLTGSGNIDFANVKAGKIETDITGVGNVSYTNVSAGTIGSNITGAGNITIAGSAEKHILNITGVGNVDDSGLKVGKLVG